MKNQPSIRTTLALQRPVPCNLDSGTTVEKDGDGRDLTSVLRGLDLLHCAVDPSSACYSRDFGGICPDSHPPSAVLRPSSPEEVSRAAHLALASSSLTLAPRGNGHWIAGQSMAVDASGIVVDMSGLSHIEIDPSSSSAWVGAGALWEDVLARAVEVCRMAPRSWTDYLGLTVGGTLSNAGISGQTFKFGPQCSNVTELEVVTGRGEVVLCSETQDSDLLFAVLGGLGQFGIITRARIPLQPVPDMVRWTRLVYVDFDDYVSDAESLVRREDSFDYIEGFVFGDGPATGYNLASFSSDDQPFDHGRIPPESGPVVYCLELVLHYNHPTTTAPPGNLSSVEERVDQMIHGLKHVRGLVFATDVSYVDFLTRVKHDDVVATSDGTWDAPHPWLNLLVSSADIVDFDLNVFKKTLRHGVESKNIGGGTGGRDILPGGVVVFKPFVSRWTVDDDGRVDRPESGDHPPLRDQRLRLQALSPSLQGGGPVEAALRDPMAEVRREEGQVRSNGYHCPRSEDFLTSTRLAP